MARKTVIRTLEIPKGWRSREAASFFAQLDELSARMFADLATCSAADLAWQSRPGMNTIGMLLAHNAIVEVYWMLIATGRYSDARLVQVLGIDGDDDGMPLAANGRPPAALRGRTLAWYRKLHDRARRFAANTAKRMTSADLRRTLDRQRPDGTPVKITVRWIPYHVLEHQAGHYGQMLLLRHLQRLPKRKTR